MTIAEQLVCDLIEASDRTQDLMNKSYARWQAGGDLEGSTQGDFYRTLQDPERLAVVFGNLNYQVGNGGFSQWIFNGYADEAMEYLEDYATRYGAKYPAIAQVGKLLEKLVEASESGQGASYDSYSRQRRQVMRRRSGDGDLASWLNSREDNQELLSQAISSQDWEECNRLLDGTDLDQRMYDRTRQDEFESALQVETHPEGDKFYCTVFLDFGPSRIELFNSKKDGELFDTEEEAGEAAEELANELHARGDLPQNAQDDLDEKTADVLYQEYKDYIQDPTDVLDELDKRYSALSPKLLVELEQLLKQEYPEAPLDKAKAALAKGWAKTKAAGKAAVDAVTAAPRKLAKKVTGVVDKFKRAGAAAAKEFNKEDLTPQQLVRQLLGEDDGRAN